MPGPGRRTATRSAAFVKIRAGVRRRTPTSTASTAAAWSMSADRSGSSAGPSTPAIQPGDELVLAQRRIAKGGRPTASGRGEGLRGQVAARSCGWCARPAAAPPALRATWRFQAAPASSRFSRRARCCCCLGPVGDLEAVQAIASARWISPAGSRWRLGRSRIERAVAEFRQGVTADHQSPDRAASATASGGTRRVAAARCTVANGRCRRRPRSASAFGLPR